MKNQDPYEKYLRPYLEFYKEAKPRMGLQIPLYIQISNWWRFDVEPGRFVINCPPYYPEFEERFKHYLSHAKIIQDGWRMPKVEYSYSGSSQTLKSLDQKEVNSLLFSFVNRSADSFFDLYVWKVFVEYFDAEILKNKINSITSIGIDDFLLDLGQKNKECGTNLNSFVRCLDIFANMRETLVEIFEDDLGLDNFYGKLQESEKFEKLLPARTVKRIEMLRANAAEMYNKYPTHKELLKKDGVLENEFRNYYSLFWENTELCVKVIGFNSSN